MKIGNDFKKLIFLSFNREQITKKRFLDSQRHVEKNKYMVVVCKKGS